MTTSLTGMSSSLAVVALAAGAANGAALASPGGDAQSTTYRIQQSITITDLPADGEQVKVWLWLPDEDQGQKLLDFRVLNCPAEYSITPTNHQGDLALYVEFARQSAEPVEVAIEALVRRDELTIDLNPEQCGPLTKDHRRVFANDLCVAIPNMEVSTDIITLANEICGDEDNVLIQAQRIYDHVVEYTDHYSKETVTPSKIGSQQYCLANGGGSCTDMHSLFIALCRARGIPARITFGSRLKPENEGLDHDPGYRCWATFFCPGLGWVPVDVAAGDTVDGGREYYFGNLDNNRVAFIHGRHLTLTPPQNGPPINIITRAAYIEVDGQPHDQFDRNVRFERLNEAPAAD